MKQMPCDSCKKLAQEAELTRLPFGDLICDACMQSEYEMIDSMYETDSNSNRNDDNNISKSDNESLSMSLYHSYSPSISSSSSSSSSSSECSSRNEEILYSSSTSNNINILKTIEDLVRYVVEINYKKRFNNTIVEEEINYSLRESDILLIRNLMNDGNDGDYEANSRRTCLETTSLSAQTTTDSTSNVNRRDETNNRTTSYVVDVKPNLVLDCLRKLQELDDMKENMTNSSNKRPRSSPFNGGLSMLDIGSKKARFD